MNILVFNQVDLSEAFGARMKIKVLKVKAKNRDNPGSEITVF